MCFVWFVFRSSNLRICVEVIVSGVSYYYESAKENEPTAAAFIGNLLLDVNLIQNETLK